MDFDSTRPPSNISILSGEVSGDLVGAALARELLVQQPGIRLWGVGSSRMREAGVELLYDSGQWSAIGVVEALKLYPRLRFRMYPSVVRAIKRRKPQIIVLIDFGAFNFKIARWCKSRGFRVFYYFPPGSWKREGKVNPEIAAVTDCVATPFPWSADRLRSIGANAHFVGHPLLEIATPTMTRSEFAGRFQMEAGRPIVGLLPGSRPFEIENNVPVMIEAAAQIQATLPDTQFVFGAGSNAVRRLIEAVLVARSKGRNGISQMTRDIAQTITALDRERRRHAAPRMVTTEGIVVSLSDLDDVRKRPVAVRPLAAGQRQIPFIIAEGLTYDVMAHSDAVIVCSGTATLETAILNTPMVIIYRGSRLMEIEYKLRRIRIKHIGLPNIIADERVVAEFVQHEATSAALADSIVQLINDPAHRSAAKSSLRKITAALGTAGASERTAKLVLQTAEMTDA